jgi:hypothetical protein
LFLECLDKAYNTFSDNRFQSAQDWIDALHTGDIVEEEWAWCIGRDPQERMNEPNVTCLRLTQCEDDVSRTHLVVKKLSNNTFQLEDRSVNGSWIMDDGQKLPIGNSYIITDINVTVSLVDCDYVLAELLAISGGE